MVAGDNNIAQARDLATDERQQAAAGQRFDVVAEPDGVQTGSAVDRGSWGR
jgi:hypothetical protein